MTTLSEHLSRSRGILNALEAVNNWRALAVLVVTGAAVALVFFLAGALGAALHSVVISGVLGLLALAVGLVGFQAAGLLFMDQARGRAPRGFVDALLGGVLCAIKLVGVVLLEFFALLAWLIVLAVVFLICKIPGIGPLLYAVAFPLAAILTGIGLFALFYVGNTVVAPAIWDGHGVLPTLSRLWEVSRKRGLAVLVGALLLALLVAVAGIVVMQVLLLGVGVTGGISASVLGTSMGLPGMDHLLGMHGAFGGYDEFHGAAGAYLVAAGFGTGLLFALALTIPIAIMMLGVCLIYLQAIEGLDFHAAEAQLRNRMEEAKRRMEEAKVRAEASMRRPEPPPASACPQCGAQNAADAAFCEQCGHKLK